MIEIVRRVVIAREPSAAVFAFDVGGNKMFSICVDDQGRHDIACEDSERAAWYAAAKVLWSRRRYKDFTRSDQVYAALRGASAEGGRSAAQISKLLGISPNNAATYLSRLYARKLARAVAGIPTGRAFGNVPLLWIRTDEEATP